MKQQIVYLPTYPPLDWEILETWGVQRLNDIDDLVCRAKLPDGWQLEVVKETDGKQGVLKDNRGFERAHTFYNAAWKDRDAYLNVEENRYIVQESSNSEYVQYCIYDHGLKRTILDFDKAEFAFMENKPQNVGCIYQNRFFYNPHGKYYKTEFTKSVNTSRVVLVRIKAKEMEERYSEDMFYRVRNACHNLTKAPVLKWLEDHRGWKC